MMVYRAAHCIRFGAGFGVNWAEMDPIESEKEVKRGGEWKFKLAH